jgi:hypothetical protein
LPCAVLELTANAVAAAIAAPVTATMATLTR